MFYLIALGEQQRNLEMLESLMTDSNTINLKSLKLFLVGPPFVGKTTTLERLLKEIENILSMGGEAKARSTLLANFSQVLTFMSGTDCKWASSSNLDEEARLLFSYMTAGVTTTDVGPETAPASTQPVTTTDVEPETATQLGVHVYSVMELLVHVVGFLVSYFKVCNI